MRFPTRLLWLNSALFIAFGLCYIAAPAFFAGIITGAAPEVSSALIDMRATYGGVSLGIGLFFGFCARLPSTVPTALVASIFVLGAMATSRLIGFLADGAPNAFMLVLLAAELLFVALGVVALRQLHNGRSVS